MKLDVFRLNRSGIRKVLGDLEAEIMECIWSQYQDAEPVPVRAVYEELHKRRRIAYTTVMSTMARLARKGMLQVDTGGQAYTYRPGVTHAQLSEKIVEHVIGSLMLNFEGETRSYIEKLSATPANEAPNRELRQAIRRGRRKES